MSATVAQLRTLLVNLENTITGDELEEVFAKVADLLEQNDTSSVIAPFDISETYDTPGADNGNPYYSESNNRLWKSKTDSNIGNTPPSDTGITEDDYWIEVSKGQSNAWSEWSAGIYGAGLIIVYHNDSFLKLLVAERPFLSSNIETELAAEQWKVIAGDAASTASAISFSPAGDIEATSVQAAIEELDNEKLAASFYKKVNLGENATTLDAGNAFKVSAYGSYTASRTLTLSNVTGLEEIKIGLTNTNANVITIAGITVYFKESQLPEGVTFASNALTFPADTAVLYNIILCRFHADSRFDGFIELRTEV
tara:strand:- start:38022 stop:38954 length:933 start_codon:yes stop_codon:yes gene_type:complete